MQKSPPQQHHKLWKENVIEDIQYHLHWINIQVSCLSFKNVKASQMFTTVVILNNMPHLKPKYALL